MARAAAPQAIGGCLLSTILTPGIVSAIYSLRRGRQVEWVKGRQPPKKSWEELNSQFVAWEKGAQQIGGSGATTASRRRDPRARVSR